MPHATAPPPGFQAFILCGPGVSLTTFTSNPKEFPKALVPIANRPMLWYPLEWCYRAGITNVQLIVPSESAPAIESALSINPHLTSLPLHKPDIIAPKDLSQTTGTGKIFRLPEVQAAIKGDFVILPCDLICELDGGKLAEAWMLQSAGFDDSVYDNNDATARFSLGGRSSVHGRKGGLGVWFQTKGEGEKKGQETDFIATVPLPPTIVPPPHDSLRNYVSQVVYAMPTDTKKDIVDEQGSLPIRHALLRKHNRVKIKTSYRDAHIYFLPYWTSKLMATQDAFDNISEDVIGWWAKATWQDGLGDKLGFQSCFAGSSEGLNGEDLTLSSVIKNEDVDVHSLSSTRYPKSKPDGHQVSKPASRAQGALDTAFSSRASASVPPILAYVQSSDQTSTLIRRVDTAHLLLSISLRLAKEQSIEDAKKAGSAPSPFAHAAKIADVEALPKQGRVEAENCLVAENVTIGERANIKESCVGAGCKIGAGARLTRCLLMEGATVGDNCQLTGCILGRRCRIEGGPRMDEGKTDLRDCEVQEAFVVPWDTEAKNEKFMVFEGLSDEGESDADAMDDEGRATIDL